MPLWQMNQRIFKRPFKSPFFSTGKKVWSDVLLWWIKYERRGVALQNGCSQQDRKRKIAAGAALCGWQHFLTTGSTRWPSFSPALMLCNGPTGNPASCQLLPESKHIFYCTCLSEGGRKLFSINRDVNKSCDWFPPGKKFHFGCKSEFMKRVSGSMSTNFLKLVPG